MFYKPNKNPLSIDPFKSLVFPRPIGWISSVDDKGLPNLAPYSYFNAIADDPPQIMFSAASPDKSRNKKDTLSNILLTKEFVVNLKKPFFATLGMPNRSEAASVWSANLEPSTQWQSHKRPEVDI